MRTLVDIRLKLLAFVPTIAGASVGLVGHPRPAADLLGVGLLGLVATLGIFLYELRNSQIYDAALDRAAQLERELGLGGALGAAPRPGVFGETRGFAASGGLSSSMERHWGRISRPWGALRALDVGGARKCGWDRRDRHRGPRDRRSAAGSSAVGETRGGGVRRRADAERGLGRGTLSRRLGAVHAP
jgi:hypothetical protein